MINHKRIKYEAERRVGRRVGEARRDLCKGNAYLAIRLYIILLGAARKRLKVERASSGFIPPDPIYGSRLVSMLIFKVMRSGRRGLAKRIVYRALSNFQAQHVGEEYVRLPYAKKRLTAAEDVSLLEREVILRKETERNEFFRLSNMVMRGTVKDQDVNRVGGREGYGVVPRFVSHFRPKEDNRVVIYNSEVKVFQAPARALARAVDRLVPTQLVKKIRRGRRRRGGVKLVPYFVTRRKGISVALKWLVGAARGLGGRQPFHRKLHRVIHLTGLGRGAALKSLRDVIRLVKQNTFHIRWKRRVKRGPQRWRFRPVLETRTFQDQF
jgi:ribosomal protein S7